MLSDRSPTNSRRPASAEALDQAASTAPASLGWPDEAASAPPSAEVADDAGAAPGAGIQTPGETAAVRCAGSGLPMERLEEELCRLAGQLAAATCRWLQLVAEFDERDGAAGWGMTSTAEWLSWRCALSPGAAREQLRVARALTKLPLLRQRFASAELSYSQARAITRVATQLPEIEEELVQHARHMSAAQLETLCKGIRAGAKAEDPPRRSHRYLRRYFDDDGWLIIHGRIPPEEGALIDTALNAHHAPSPARPDDGVAADNTDVDTDRKSDDKTDHPQTKRHAPDVPATPKQPNSRPDSAGHVGDNRDEEPEPAEPTSAVAEDPESNNGVTGRRPQDDLAGGEDSRDNNKENIHAEDNHDAEDDHDDEDPQATPPSDRQAADALAAMAQSFLHNRDHGSRADRYQVLILIDSDTLLEDTAGTSRIGGGGPGLHANTVRRLLCNSAFAPLVHKGEDLLNIGRSSRALTLGQRRGLEVRDNGRCRFPGCRRRRGVEAHHIIWWSQGGPTNLDNLLLLCRRHHMQVHEDGYTITVHQEPNQPTRFTFKRPDSTQIGNPGLPGNSPGASPNDGNNDLPPHDARITAKTLPPRWGADHGQINYPYAISCFLDAAPHRRHHNTNDVA